LHWLQELSELLPFQHHNMSQADAELYEKNTLGINYAAGASLRFQRMRYNTAKLLVYDAEQVSKGIEKFKNMLKILKNIKFV